MFVQMLETFSGLAIGQMVAERATLVLRMSEIEDWDIVAASHKTGSPLPSDQQLNLQSIASRLGLYCLTWTLVCELLRGVTSSARSGSSPAKATAVVTGRGFPRCVTGAPVSAMPGRLRAVVCRGMEQVQAVLVEAQRAEAVAPSRTLNVLGRPPCRVVTPCPVARPTHL